MNNSSALIGKRNKEYGGIYTDINSLEVGTVFYVCNGAWTGKIVERNGKKFVDLGESFEDLIEITPDKNTILAISDIRKAQQINSTVKLCITSKDIEYMVHVPIIREECQNDKEGAFSVMRQIESFILEHLQNVDSWRTLN